MFPVSAQLLETLKPNSELRAPLRFFVLAKSVQGFSWWFMIGDRHESSVQFFFNQANKFFWISWDITSFGNIFADVFVGVFNRPFFPRTVWIAKIYFNIEKLFQPFVMPQEQIIVSGDGLEFRESLFNLEKSFFHVSDWDIQNLFDERYSDFSIGKGEQYTVACFSWHDEVWLGISQSLSFVDILGSFVDEDSIVKLQYFDTTTSVSVPFPFSEMLNFSSIHTSNEAIYAFFWNCR